MDKKEKKGNKKILIATVVLGTLLIFTVAFSIVFFFMRIKSTQSLLDTGDIKTYDNYYVMITDERDTDFWRSVYAGAQEEAEANNAYIELLGEDLDADLSKQDLLRIAISSDVDGIILDGDESDETVELIQKATDEGIPVVTISDDMTDSKRVSYIGVSSYNLGKEYGEQLADYVKENGISDCDVLVLMDESLNSNSQSIIFTAINEAIEKRNLSDVISLNSQIVNSNKDYAAEEEIRDIFVGEDAKDIPDVIICLSETNTTCVYQTVVDYNKVGEVEIFGYYISPTIRSAIEKDIIKSSIVVDTNQMGKKSVEAVNEYKQSGYVSEIYIIDTQLATKETLDSFNGEGGDGNAKKDE